MNTVEQHLTPLVGQYVWDVDWNSQLSLRMSFGAPYLRVLEPLPSRPQSRIVVARGHWWLWAYFAYWKISLKGERSAKGGTSKVRSPLKRILRATHGLAGQVVTGVEVKPRTGAVTLMFDLGGELDIRPIKRGTQDDVWLLYQREGSPILTVRADGKFSYRESTDREDWHSIE